MIKLLQLKTFAVRLKYYFKKGNNNNLIEIKLLQLETFAVRLKYYFKKGNNNNLIEFVDELLKKFNDALNSIDSCNCEEQINNTFDEENCPTHGNLLCVLSKHYHAGKFDLFECAGNVAIRYHADNIKRSKCARNLAMHY
jgi:hypothetical protein